MLDQEGDHRGALEAATRAHDIAVACGNLRGQARSRDTMGWSHLHLGELDEALRLCREALEVAERIDDVECRANTCDSLGDIHHRRGELAEAALGYRQAADLWEELGIHRRQAVTLDRLGDVQQEAGERPDALDSWRRALAVFDRLEHPDAADVRDKLAAARDDPDTGGDPVCWLHRACPECGAMPSEAESTDSCWRCGHPLTAAPG